MNSNIVFLLLQKNFKKTLYFFTLIVYNGNMVFCAAAQAAGKTGENPAQFRYGISEPGRNFMSLRENVGRRRRRDDDKSGYRHRKRADLRERMMRITRVKAGLLRAFCLRIILAGQCDRHFFERILKWNTGNCTVWG